MPFLQGIKKLFWQVPMVFGVFFLMSGVASASGCIFTDEGANALCDHKGVVECEDINGCSVVGGFCVTDDKVYEGLAFGFYIGTHESWYMNPFLNAILACESQEQWGIYPLDWNYEDCGDGVLDFTETCDDGDTSSGDGCSATCFLELGWECTGSPSLCSIICGDGILIGDEECDDGETSSGDGCSNVCAIEEGFECNGEPSVCLGVGGGSMPTLSSGDISTLFDSFAVAIGGIFTFLIDGAVLWLTIATALMIIWFLKRWLDLNPKKGNIPVEVKERPKYLKSRL